MITTTLITKNHEDIITPTLESLSSLGPILIADLGSQDKTLEICKKYNAKVLKANFNYNYSEIRNTLSSKADTEWLFWIDPGETIMTGKELLLADKTDQMYRVMVLNGDMLLKQARIFKKHHRFENRVFESLKDVSEQTLPIVVTGQTRKNDISDCLMRWKDDDPLSPKSDYYLACFQLMNGNYEKFKGLADQFLFQKKVMDAPAILTKYYLASIIKKKETGKALKLALECVATYPLMAEFWCLLGDIHFFYLKHIDRAYHFYENAIILGSRRLEEDVMPMEISKYEDYPKKMMELIKSTVKSAME